jgi:hypothetical protein
MSKATIVENWNFRPSSAEWRWRAKRVKAFAKGVCWAPPYSEVRPLSKRSHWTVYFVYAPSGSLSESQRFTFRKLKETKRGLCVICAAPLASSVPDELADADALYWKHMRGYDFSAYRIGLELVAKHSSGSDVLFLNDSVLGPFSDLDLLLASSPWEMTGFTASASRENHIQSYAFHVRDVSSRRLRELQTIVPGTIALDTYDAVITCQETRMARIAARSMSVGSLWFCGDGNSPPLSRALDLLERGFPFIKKSLLDKSAHFQDVREVRARLRSFGHPLSQHSSED